MHNPKTVTELANLIEQAAFEFEELSVCVEEDIDDEQHDYAFEFEAMARALMTLKSQIEDKAAYVDSNGLVFMERARQLRPIIPFFQLVNAIDSACRRGVVEKSANVR